MPASEISLSVIVLSEARELLSVLRRNRRFGYLLSFTAASQPAEHPLVKEVKSLRDIVRSQTNSTVSGLSEPFFADGLLIPPEALLNALDPFLEVVKSRDASGIITGVALLSLDRIATRILALAERYDALPQYAVALSSIVDAASACRFDATDPAADEVVLARITRVIVRLMTSAALPLLPDASILRAVEACLGIAAGRRRASDLLKRTADAAIIDVFSGLGQRIDVVCGPSNSVPNGTKGRSRPSSVIAEGVTGPVFGYALDTESFSQHGPASVEVVSALLELCARMCDPSIGTSQPERALGMEMLTALLTSAGTRLKDHSVLRDRLLRDCCRATLRSLGMFRSPPSVISAAFSVAIQLVQILGEEGAPFLLALLERVYPYYISGYENLLPEVGRSSDESSIAEGTRDGANGSHAHQANTSNGSAEAGATEIDPVIREIGLESLAALLSTPGLLCVVYRVADCYLRRSDVVTPLIRSLGYAVRTKRTRKRSKRLRASSSGSNRVSATTEADSDEEDAALGAGNGNSESLRFARAATMLCAESILVVVDTINNQLKIQADGSVQRPDGNMELVLASRTIRREKTRLQRAAESFNESEKLNKASKLLSMLREHGLAEKPSDTSGTVSEDFEEDVRAAVQFLRGTPGLSKEKIGVILGEPDTLSRRVLSDYTATFEFTDRPFTESLRVFLESFRLPGEAQKIDRIVQSFANRYYEQNKSNPPSGTEDSTVTKSPSEIASETNGTVNGSAGKDGSGAASDDEARLSSEMEEAHHHSTGVLKTADAAYVLSFSVVMLNTDQHNDSIRKKMTLEDFLRNCRGINDGENLPKWFLTEIFNSIAAVEIRMSDEVGIGALTDLLWDEQMRLFQSNSKEVPRMDESGGFEEELFTLSWESAIAAANFIMNEAADANSVQTALEGFLSIARCATAYKTSRPSDAVISSLTTATTLREGPLFGAITRFGTDIKAQMACVALSGVSRQCADWLGASGWQSLVSYLLRIHALCLLPSQVEQHIGENGSEITGVDRKEVSYPRLIPSWWPSQREGTQSKALEEKPRKPSRPNGFLAAIIAASIGSEADSEEDDEFDSSQNSSRDGRALRKTSNVPPHYLRMRGPEEQEAQDLARKCIASCRVEDVIINEAKVLQSSALEHLSKAIARSAYRTMDGGKSQSHKEDLDEGSEDVTDLSILDWSEISPPSPRGDSSAIVGVTNKQRLTSSESDSDFSSFGLAPWTGQNRERDEKKAREFVVSFCIDVLCELALQNRDRLHVPWPSLHGLIVKVIAPATQPSPALERAVVALLRVGVRLLHRDEVRDDVLRGLNLLLRLPTDAAEMLSVPIAAGVYNIVRTHGAGIQSTSGWHAILSIMEGTARYQPEAREIGLQTLSSILRGNSCPDAVSAETFTPLLHAVLAYTSCSSVEVSISALELLYHLSQRIRYFSRKEFSENKEAPIVKSSSIRSDEGGELWSEFWGPLFLGFATAVRDPRGKVRNSALGVLERVVASGGSAQSLSAEQWNQALSTVLLPLMTQLFTSHGFFDATLEAEQAAQRKLLAQRSATSTISRSRSRTITASAEHQEQLRKSVLAACNRTRMRAVTLTSKAFLQHHSAIASGLTEDAFTELWIAVLEVFRVAVESGAGNSFEGRSSPEKHDDLAEHVPENVKNLLLVMSDCGLLTSDQHVRWNATFTVARKFVPNVEEILSATTKDPGMLRAESVQEENKVEPNDGSETQNGTTEGNSEVTPASSKGPVPVSSSSMGS